MSGNSFTSRSITREAAARLIADAVAARRAHRIEPVGCDCRCGWRPEGV